MKKRNIILLIAFIVLAAVMAYLLLNPEKTVSHAVVQEVPVKEEISGSAFNLEVASTEAEREKGLGDRDSLAPEQGMLFVFDHLDTYGFWMKDTYFPLDIVWLNQSCAVVGKATMQPESFPKVFYPDFPAEYAIELPLGAASSTVEGDVLPCQAIEAASHL